MIEDDRIKALSNVASCVSASGRIDARGRNVLPGAIDPNVHYGIYTPINEAARPESRSAESPQ